MKRARTPSPIPSVPAPASLNGKKLVLTMGSLAIMRADFGFEFFEEIGGGMKALLKDEFLKAVYFAGSRKWEPAPTLEEIGETDPSEVIAAVTHCVSEQMGKLEAVMRAKKT